MAALGIATALMVGFAQIIEGEATCCACEKPAALTTWNGADPDAEPVCIDHALIVLDMSRRVMVDLFGQTREG